MQPDLFAFFQNKITRRNCQEKKAKFLYFFFESLKQKILSKPHSHVNIFCKVPKATKKQKRVIFLLWPWPFWSACNMVWNWSLSQVLFWIWAFWKFSLGEHAWSVTFNFKKEWSWVLSGEIKTGTGMNTFENLVTLKLAKVGRKGNPYYFEHSLLLFILKSGGWIALCANLPT